MQLAKEDAERERERERDEIERERIQDEREREKKRSDFHFFASSPNSHTPPQCTSFSICIFPPQLVHCFPHYSNELSKEMAGIPSVSEKIRRQ